MLPAFPKIDKSRTESWKPSPTKGGFLEQTKDPLLAVAAADHVVVFTLDRRRLSVE